jgi:signal transduction histidine kinase
MKFRPVPGAYGVEDVTILDEGGRVASGGGNDGSMVAAAGLIHDLGNLIQIAYSAINILARTPDMPAPRSGPILHRARSCLEHAGALVRQNIELARDRTIPGERSDVAACLSEVAALVVAMDEPGLILETDIEPGLPALRCDPIGLRRVLLNLVFNARDAVAGGGHIMIAARSIRGDQRLAAVEIRVVDNGVGMSAATIARIFDPFFTTKANGLGGIGLPMVERFVRDVGGEIAIDSEPGLGTTVALRLPAASAGGTSTIIRTEIISEERDQ